MKDKLNNLLDALVANSKENVTSFHMPGHKGKGPLANLNEALTNHGLSLDVTELPGLDNLQCPTGILKNLEEQVAQAFGAKESFLLVNGATAGILAGMLATTKPKQQVLLPRNCHRAFWSALVLGDLEPIFVMPTIDPQYQLALPAGIEDYKKALAADMSAKPRVAVIINPTYEGLVANIDQLIAWAREEQLFTIVDEAHGTLFNMNEQLPLSGLQAGGDVVVHGAHKTLGSLTQSGLVHLGTETVSPTKMRQALKTVQTTSPSYLLMASLSEGVGNAQTDRLIELAAEFRKELGEIKGYSLVDEDAINYRQVYDRDLTRLVISPAGLNLSGIQLGELLREEYSIQVEMTQECYLVAMLGTGTTKEHLDKLIYALKDISSRYGAEHKEKKNLNQSQRAGGSFYQALAKGLVKPKLIVSPRESFYSEVAEVPLEDGVGKIAGEMICPYPPGIPLVYPGELLSPELVEYLQGALGSDQKTKKIKILV